MVQFSFKSDFGRAGEKYLGNVFVDLFGFISYLLAWFMYIEILDYSKGKNQSSLNPLEWRLFLQASIHINGMERTEFSNYFLS